MTVPVAHLIIPQGTSFTREIETTLDLTGYQAEGFFAKSYYHTSIRYEFNTEVIEPDSNNSNWRVLFSLAPDDTRTIEHDYYVYAIDVFRYDSNHDARTRLLEGVIDLQPRV